MEQQIKAMSSSNRLKAARVKASVLIHSKSFSATLQKVVLFKKVYQAVDIEDDSLI